MDITTSFVIPSVESFFNIRCTIFLNLLYTYQMYNLCKIDILWAYLFLNM
jgi:hypothetical protein